MAAVHVTLEEAAARLGISPDEFKRRLKTDPNFKILVPIRDGATLRFKASMVDELARQLGGASDPGLYLAPIPEKADKDSDELRLTTLLVEGTQTPSTTPPSTTHDEADIFSFAPEPSSSSKGEARPISEVRLGASSRKLSSTSGNIHKSDVSPGEEINLDLGSSHSAVIRGASSSKLVPSPSTSKISGSGVGSAASSPRSQQQADDSSEFQLSLEPEGDDLQLSLNEESDEVKVGEELTVNPTHGASGINLHKPTDSGISLEKDSPAPLLTTEKSSGDELDFELTLDSHTAASGVKLSGLINKPSMVSDSDSEFELTLDDSSSDAASMEHAALEELQEEKDVSRGDIFETDFEVPPLEDSSSASEAVALETDTELSGEDYSEVVVEETSEADLGEEGSVDVDLAEEDLVAAPSASQALRGVPTAYAEEEELAAVPAGEYRPAPWGPVPAILLLLAFPFMFLGVLIGYQTVETMVGYQQPQKPVAPLIRSIASTLDMELKDQ